MTRIITAVLAALAFSNVAFAQQSTEQMSNKAAEQRQSFDFLTKYSPL